MSFEAGVRRTPPDVRVPPPSDPVLVDRLRAEIAWSGPIPFARFMEVALADPDHGYYATSDDRPTREGDFLTAPELHPIFGATIARSLGEQWLLLGRPDPFLLVEYGAGSGALAVAILRRLAIDGSDLVEALRYVPVELGRGREARIRARLEAAGFGDAVAESASAVDPEAGVTGAVLANEFLDALPVHRVERRGDRLVELFVDWSDRDARFIDFAGELSTATLADRLADEEILLEDGQRAEICLGIDEWVTDATQRIGRGFGVVIDYGRAAADLYVPARRAGTIRAYSGQHVHDDPYVAIGRQDLTAHVDFTAVERAALSNGWRALGLTTQAQFLAGSGLGEVLQERQADPSMSVSDFLGLRASVMRLLDPHALGGFRVLVLGRGVPEGATLRGLHPQTGR